MTLSHSLTSSLSGPLRSLPLSLLPPPLPPPPSLPPSLSPLLVLAQATTTLAATQAEATRSAAELKAQVADMQAQLDDFESAQKSMMARKEADIKAAKAALAGFESTHRQLQKQFKTVEVECGALAEERADLERQCKEYGAECDKIRDSLVRIAQYRYDCSSTSAYVPNSSSSSSSNNNAGWFAVSVILNE